MMALAGAMRAADSVEPGAFLSALHRLQFDGVTGRIGFDAQGNLHRPDVSVFIYRGGERVLVAGS